MRQRAGQVGGSAPRAGRSGSVPDVCRIAAASSMERLRKRSDFLSAADRMQGGTRGFVLSGERAAPKSGPTVGLLTVRGMS